MRRIGTSTPPDMPITIPPGSSGTPCARVGQDSCGNDPRRSEPLTMPCQANQEPSVLICTGAGKEQQSPNHYTHDKETA